MEIKLTGWQGVEEEEDSTYARLEKDEDGDWTYADGPVIPLSDGDKRYHPSYHWIALLNTFLCLVLAVLAFSSSGTIR